MKVYGIFILFHVHSSFTGKTYRLQTILTTDIYNRDKVNVFLF